jgi:hypothetical protein
MITKNERTSSEVRKFIEVPINSNNSVENEENRSYSSLSESKRGLNYIDETTQEFLIEKLQQTKITSDRKANNNLRTGSAVRSNKRNESKFNRGLSGAFFQASELISVIGNPSESNRSLFAYRLMPIKVKMNTAIMKITIKARELSKALIILKKSKCSDLNREDILIAPNRRKDRMAVDPEVEFCLTPPKS